ncbi:MAG: AAA family ATPase [Pyrinomonadaceae bacterium]|nr:AAA family ATPase [Pyrinomonadaceae bacterium]
MIKSVHFKNFKVLRNATLPLSRFTLIVGPNGSGKSTAIQAISMAFPGSGSSYPSSILPASQQHAAEVTIEITINWDVAGIPVTSKSKWGRNANGYWFQKPEHIDALGKSVEAALATNLDNVLSRVRVFSFEAAAISASAYLDPAPELSLNGSNLAAVLDDLRNSEEERFEALNEELGRWLPEYDRVLFETKVMGQRTFSLRTRVGRHRIQASDLSHGTLLALAFLTLAYLPNPPSIVCFEEPERGIHPRLLREVQDAMYRLCYPENYGESRDPVQVVATTHSPYLLDLYKDHPEEIVIAEKEGQETKFARLSEKPNVEDFLQDAPLGEVWYSGILGGVPSRP